MTGNKTITELTTLATVDHNADWLPVVDVSDTTESSYGTTKKAIASQFIGATGVGDQGDTGVGTQGDTGVGTQGDTGVGTVGATGVAGNQGDTGIGTVGATGVQGNTGVGEKGDTGVGTQGDTGVGTVGATGADGEKGDTGVGTTGATGSDGNQGDTGVGVQGDTGVGVQGDTGIGLQGDTGVGTVGATGVGEKGDTGADSTVPGPQGDTGVGVQGDTGIGTVGATGADGDQGDTGVGLQGDTGVGTVGATGISGDQGDTGVGTVGATGSQGNQGDTGVGTVGATGIQGDTGPNNITTATTTNLTGYLYGNGSTIVSKGTEDGWIPAGETWTYSSVDDPTGVFTVSGDVTGKYCDGMKIKLTNGGNTIYGIISKTPTYSSPNTTVTFLHEINPGTNQAVNLLANSAITNPYYSTAKAPYPFPHEPTKWTMILKDTTGATQATPSQNQWYNLLSLSLTVPIGSWRLGYYHLFGAQDTSATAVSAATTLSTANNTEAIPDLTIYTAYIGPTGSITVRNHAHQEMSLSLTTKTTYYLNTATFGSGVENLYSWGSIRPTRIYAECTLL